MRRSPTGIVMLCGLMVTAGCTLPDEAREGGEPVGSVRQAFAALTPIESEAVGPDACLRGHYYASPWGNVSAAAAAHHSKNKYGTQYAAVWRSGDPTNACGSPYNLNYMLIDGNAGPMFGKVTTKVLGPTACRDGDPVICFGRDFDGTTWPVAFSADEERYAVFSYHRFLTTGASSLEVRAFRVDATGATDDELVASCSSAAGPPECYVRDASIASSERQDDTDRILVGYLQDASMTDDWMLRAVLYTPGSGVVSLPSTLPCAQAPCARGGAKPDTEVAYNRIEDKFLLVSVFPLTSPNPRLIGRIYDGTTGAAGLTIDLGAPSSTSGRLGVASNPDALVNPDGGWVVAYGTDRYHVAADGTFAQGTWNPVPNPVTGEWTLNWVSAISDSYDYERLIDSDSDHAVRSGRYPAAFSVGAEYDLDAPQLDGYVEDLAHDLFGDHSLALWSDWVETYSAGWVAGYRWRIVDQ